MFSKFNIAYIYAKAVFDLSMEYKNTSQWRWVLELFAKISQDNIIQSLCLNFLGVKKLSYFLIMVFEDYSKKKLDIFGRNFIQIIVKNNRIYLLSAVFEEFNKLYNDHINYTVIEIISARKLNNNQLKKITEIMVHRLSKQVKVVCRIDHTILAGFIIKIGNTIIDGSLTGKILRLRNILQS